MTTETIYVDSLNHCHRRNDGTMAAVETSFFSDRCDSFVEGFCYEVMENGTIAIYPWVNLSELDAAQREYERQMMKEYEALVDDLYTEVTS